MLTEKFPHSPVSGSRRLTSNFTLIELLIGGSISVKLRKTAVVRPIGPEQFCFMVTDSLFW